MKRWKRLKKTCQANTACVTCRNGEYCSSGYDHNVLHAILDKSYDAWEVADMKRLKNYVKWLNEEV